MPPGPGSRPDGAGAGGQPQAPPRAPVARPRRAPSPRRSRYGPILVVTAMLLSVAGGLAFLAIYLMGPTGRTYPSEGAERFVNCVCLGDEPDPQQAGDPDALCGYAVAYDMLAPRIRSTLGYATFCADFEHIRETCGPVQRMEKGGYERLRRFSLVRFAYDLFFGNPDARLDDLKVFSLALTMEWSDDAWVVVDYHLTPVVDREVR